MYVLEQGSEHYDPCEIFLVLPNYLLTYSQGTWNTWKLSFKFLSQLFFLEVQFNTQFTLGITDSSGQELALSSVYMGTNETAPKP